MEEISEVEFREGERWGRTVDPQILPVREDHITHPGKFYMIARKQLQMI